MLKKLVLVLGCWVGAHGLVLAESGIWQDTTGTKTVNGKTYLTHKVKSGETLYALSRKYDVALAQIIEANKNVEKSLHVGQTVLIPVKGNTSNTASATATKPAAKPASPESPAANHTYEVDAKGNKKHTVQPRQTLFSIAKQHDVSVDDLKKWNKLSESKVVVGQNLIVGVGAKAPSAAAAATKVYVPEADDVVTAPKKKDDASLNTAVSSTANVPVTTPKTAKSETDEDKTTSKTSDYVSRVNESGMAEQIDQRADANKFLALHRTAPVGTIMAVKNPQNDQTVYVRVIGKLPATGDNDKVVVKLSKKACQQIGALDKRFRVEVSYMP